MRRVTRSDRPENRVVIGAARETKCRGTECRDIVDRLLDNLLLLLLLSGSSIGDSCHIVSPSLSVIKAVFNYILAASHAVSFLRSLSCLVLSQIVHLL